MTPKSSISFELNKLGWKAFEDLAGCVFREVLGQTLQVFAEGADGGRDAAFKGNWTTNDKEDFSGSFTIQCKHTSSTSKSLPKSTIQEELPKISRLSKEGLCDNYLFVTNHTVSAIKAAKVEKEFVSTGAKVAKVFGSDWINTTISENPRLRRLVPRIYGLGDLTQIVTHNAYSQSIGVLESNISDLNCFVPTEAYRKSANALNECGFVLLIGEAASGKTMIANLLALSAADEWDLQTIMLSSPEEFSELWNPNDPGQFFWVDDAFGSTQYEPGRVQEWNHRFSKLKTAIHKGARVVFTSRDYIFNAAKKNLKISTFDLLNDSRVVIEVEKLSIAERQMILYNHLKCGQQPKKFRKLVKPFLVEVSKTPKFLPEIARRFASPKFTKALQPRKNPVLDFFEKPMNWLKDVLDSLNTQDRASIALVFIEGGRLESPIKEDEFTLKIIDSLNATVGDVKDSLFKLNGTFLQFDKSSQEWHFKHPTIRDAFASIIGSNPEFINIYLAGVKTEQLITEVTCGNVGLKGAEIVVPEMYFETVISKLSKYNKNRKWIWIDPVESFLAHRCSDAFLHKYYSITGEMTQLPKRISSLFGFNNELVILNKLHLSGCLPEGLRQETAGKIREVSKSHASIRFFDKKVVGELLNEEDIVEHWTHLKKYIRSEWEVIVDDIKCSWDGENEPYDEFDELRSTLNKIEEEGSGDEKQDAIEIIEVIDGYVSEMEKEQEDEAEYNSLDAEETETESIQIDRCIFDDVDE